VDGAFGYNVYRSNSSDGVFGTQINAAVVLDTFFIDENVSELTKAFYQIRATDGGE